MTVGRFKEKLGTIRNNRIKGRDLEILYGLQGNDRLSSRRGSATRDVATILVGGSGGDRYKAAKKSTTIVLENGGSTADILVAKGIGFNRETSFVAEIDGRHLVASDTASGQSVILLDWQAPSQQIGTFVLSGGRYSYGELATRVRNTENYLGNVSWAELNQSGALDLGRVGLNTRSVNRAIRRIGRRAKRLEKKQIQSTRDRLTGLSQGDILVGKTGEHEPFQPSKRHHRGDRSSQSSSILPLSEEGRHRVDIAPVSYSDGLGLMPFQSHDGLSVVNDTPLMSVFPQGN